MRDFYCVYEMGKKHPVAVILKDGRCVSLDPYDLEEMTETKEGFCFDEEKGRVS